MIVSFKHKGLKRFFEKGDISGIQATHAKKLHRYLTLLNRVAREEELAVFANAGIHRLKGDRFGQWSMRVSGNWRITFIFDEGDVYVLNYEDYH